MLRFLETRLRRLDGDQEGAVFLLCLAGVMVLLLASWVVYDAGNAVRARMMLQGAADSAANSHAAIQARAMNQVAYGNIAKRTVVGIHATYPSMLRAYDDWIRPYAWQCEGGDDHACQVFFENAELFEIEYSNDWQAYVQNTESYYLQDLVAIDNYQRYLIHLTPWWAWSESVFRAARNGATFSATFPTPTGQLNDNARSVLQIAQQVSNAAGSSLVVNTTGRRAEGLPLVRGSDTEMLHVGMAQPSFHQQHRTFEQWHQENSELGAASLEVVENARAYFPAFVQQQSMRVFGEVARPWVLPNYRNEAEWLTQSSTVVLAYVEQPELFGEKRQKFEIAGEDYNRHKAYEVEGYWTLARSELSYTAGTPDMWHPQWTGRLRPVALPNEFREAGLQLATVYRDTIPFLALGQWTLQGSFQPGEKRLGDMVALERAVRAMGQSTIEGVSK